MLLPATIWWAIGVPNKGNIKPSMWRLIREGHPRMAIFTGEKRWFMKIDEKSITRSVEECENKDTPHTSQNFDDYSEWRTTKSQPCAPDSRNQSISEQAQVRYKMKNYNKKWFKSKCCITPHHFWSQKSGHHQPELWVFRGKTNDSVFSPEVEARCARKDLNTA